MSNSNRFRPEQIPPMAYRMNSLNNEARGAVEMEHPFATLRGGIGHGEFRQTLNNATVSVRRINEKVSGPGVIRLARAIALLQAHKADLARFLTSDSEGQKVLTNLCLLAVQMADEQTQLLQELDLLTADINRLRQITASESDSVPSLFSVKIRN